MLKVAPALAAGCSSAVLKPAEETPMSALKLEGDLPGGGSARRRPERHHRPAGDHGAALTAHPDVDKIASTGSTEVGWLIVHAAAGNLKRLTLELGGKSPLIMFDDANLDKAIMGAGMGLLAGSGQNCSCTSRIYVQRKIGDQVVEGWRVRTDAADGWLRRSQLRPRSSDQREAAHPGGGIVSDGVLAARR